MRRVENRDDCNVIVEGIENSFEDLGNCVVSLFNADKSIVRNIFKLGTSVTKLALDTTSCAIKHTPQAMTALAEIKQEIVNSVENEYREYQKEQQKEAFDAKIKQLKLKK